jgi:PHD/YefM family antitoxin component YafN of YafNO toxin-antitoxin module
MADALTSRSDALERLARDLPSFSATRLVAGMQTVTSAVMAKGAVVITRHDQPSMVLMSVDRYLTLEQAAEPNLDALTRQFDDLFARMQGASALQGMADAFAMTPRALGKAAVKAAQGKSTAK